MLSTDKTHEMCLKQIMSSKPFYNEEKSPVLQDFLKKQLKNKGNYLLNCMVIIEITEKKHQNTKCTLAKRQNASIIK